MNLEIKNIKNIPSGPGVYFFYGPPSARQGPKRLLYIGKATNLKARINSHFQSDPSHPAKSQMLKKTVSIKYQKTQSEIEALILEAKLIKKYKPFYNIALRDDKNYFFVAQTKETFSRIFITHQPNKIKNFYLGPFTSGNELKTVLNYLRHIFPYCTCKQAHLRKCVNAEIGKCLNFCCNKTLVPNEKQKKEYQKNIKSIWQVLSGRKKYLLNQLKKEMKIKAKSLEFEAAAKIHNQIQALTRIFGHQPVLETKKLEIQTAKNLLAKIKALLKLPKEPIRIEAYDISNLQGKNATGSMIVFSAKGGSFKPQKNAYRKFKIQLKNKPDDTGMIKEMLIRRLTHLDWPLPDLFLIDGGQGQLNTALKIIRKSELKTPVVALAKKEEELYSEKKLKPIALKNQEPEILFFFQQIRDEAHRFALTYHKKLRARKNLT